MTINIFTDASLNTNNGNAGYAFYIGCREFRIQQSGALKIKTKKPDLAELHTIANALHKLSKLKVKNCTKVNIYTDSLISIRRITGLAKTPVNDDRNEALQEVMLCMYEFCMSQGLNIRKALHTFSFIHVRAHTNKTDKHSVINDWCDVEAKKQRIALDKKIK